MRLFLIPLTLVACTLVVQAQVFLPQSDQDLMVQKGGQLQTTMPAFWNTPVILPQLSSQNPSAGHSWIGYNQSAGIDTTTVVDQWGNFKTFGGMVGFGHDICSSQDGSLWLSFRKYLLCLLS